MLGFLKRGKKDDRRIVLWRKQWVEATEAPDAAAARALRARLDQITAGSADDDRFEIEREMLDSLDALVELSARLANDGPPVVQTGHRIVAGEACHFSAPASLPDDPSQPAGTLLLTASRLIFVGGSRSMTVPWHGIARCLPHDRDLVAVRRDREALHRVRCNTYTDALRAVCLARHLSSRRRV